MTGHIGERINREVALVTDDFRLYFDLVPRFEAIGLHLLGLRPGEAVPDAVRVLLGGPADDPRSVAPREDPQATILACLSALDPRPTAEGGYRRVVFGVDPGDAIGLAVVGDGRPLMVDQVFDPEAAAARIAAWMTGLVAREWRAHIGDGAPDVGIRLEGVLHKLPGVHVRFVPEDATSPESPHTGSRHMDAAVHIALREPPAAPG